MPNPSERNITTYVTGFVFSVVLTLAAYFVVQIHVNSEHTIISHAILIPTILTLAFVQLIVQLVFFLHLGFGTGSRAKTAIFVSTIAFVLLIVVGSLWIMNHLNYNMTPDQIDQYMQDQQGGF